MNCAARCTLLFIGLIQTYFGFATAFRQHRALTRGVPVPGRIESVHRFGKDNIVPTGTDVESSRLEIRDIELCLGARLQSDQAEADTRVAQARAEARLAQAVANEQEMKASVAASRAALVLAEADVPIAVAAALRAGLFFAKRPMRSPRRQDGTPKLPSVPANPHQPDRRQPERPASRLSGGSG